MSEKATNTVLGIVEVGIVAAFAYAVFVALPFV